MLILQAFAIFCGMGIHNTQMYENTVRAMARQSVALEVLSYHASAPMEEVNRLKVSCCKLIKYNLKGHFLPCAIRDVSVVISHKPPLKYLKLK